MYTIGGSAGGTLSLSLARRILLGQSPLPKNAIKGVVSFVPSAFHPKNIPKQFKAEHTSLTDNATNAPFIDRSSVESCNDLCGLGPSDQEYLVGNDPESYKLFPPTYIATCEFDPLRDDGKIMARALKEAGVPVRYDHYDGLPHCFWFVPKLPETAVFMQNTVAGIEWVIEQIA
tara:strand:- start:17737 stop:18258 length:522 start_codon:yes stop_codon:yes gene_type:complete